MFLFNYSFNNPNEFKGNLIKFLPAGENESSLKMNCLKRWLSPKDLHAEFGFSESSQAKMRMTSNSSTLPFSKVGKYIRYDRVEINSWLESHKVQ